jgi:Ca2+:H+ antiporter
MMQREAPTPAPRTESRGLFAGLAVETPTVAGIATTVLFFAFQDVFFADLSNYPRTIFLFVWLFGVMLWGAFGVVRHADALADKLGEPYGTLVLTFSVITMEVSLMAAIMLHGENNPTLARDAMFATLMIVLNGMIGTALLVGALRYWEQEYNLEGARAFLVVIASLAVFALIIPNYTKTVPDPSLSPFQAGLFAVITILFYVLFLTIQTMRHRAFLAEPQGNGDHNRVASAYDSRRMHRHATGSLRYHVVTLLVTLVPIVLMSKYIAMPVDLGIEQIGLPAELGGILIAVLVLSPEGLSAMRAALDNQLQRAVNVCLGLALATIGLTIPAVLMIGLLAGLEVHLGLDTLHAVLLILTLFVSALTFGGARTNVLQGVVHLLLFVVYIALIFSP